MATIVSRYRTTVAMMNSIHDLLSENHPCTLFMVSLHPGYHDPPNSTHYIINHILLFDDGAAPGGVLSSVSGQSDWSPSWRTGRESPWLIHTGRGLADVVPVRGVCSPTSGRSIPGWTGAGSPGSTKEA